ncbi:hypothetical protein GQ55_9G346000 [Panicum hallii var. hallii]|uniref:Uncharacterized protein n=1 Tax=Panicum hallii var. hallii TaxID=1504633 RepID=A0A2T7C8I6_9POAL|nr:hypothetical protein GQ55_9G346000 [Panicum hallii var. hallii]
MEMRECPQYPDLVRSNSRDFVDSLIKAWQKNLRSFQQLKIQITKLHFNYCERISLLEPSIKERDAVYESLTYSSELYVSAD